jgi:hypothetical protein
VNDDDDVQKKTNIHAFNEILTYGPSVKAVKANSSDCEATGTGKRNFLIS